MAPTNKIINALKDKIAKVKSKESVFDKDKQLKQYDLTNIKVKIDKVFEQIRDLKNKKYRCKEDFYGRMCDYEIEQALIKDIEWISQTKAMVLERSERDKIYEQRRKERQDQQKKEYEAREKKRAEIRA